MCWRSRRLPHENPRCHTEKPVRSKACRIDPFLAALRRWSGVDMVAPPESSAHNESIRFIRLKNLWDRLLANSRLRLLTQAIYLFDEACSGMLA